MKSCLYIKFKYFKFKLISLKKTDKYGKKANLALSLWIKLSRAASTFGKIVAVNIRSFDLTEPQFAMLECLGHLGPLKLGELSKKMLVSGGNITCVVDNLEKEGFIERVRVAEDRRVVLVRLTPRGKKLFDDVFIQHAEFITRIASVLTEYEQETLARLLKKLGLSLKEFKSNQNGIK